MISLELNISEVLEIDRKIQRFQGRRGRARFDLMQAVGDDVMEREKNRIGDQYDPDGQPWAPWSEGYVGNALLNLTGRMAGSFQSRATQKTATIENKAPYFKFHQGGTKNMPARKVFGWGSEEIEIANKHAVDHLLEMFV